MPLQWFNIPQKEEFHCCLNVNHPLLTFSEYRRIQSALSLCNVPSSAEDIHQLNGLLRNAFTMMAMLDYPYSTHFMGNMPANPVKVNCAQIKSDTVQEMLLFKLAISLDDQWS